MARPVIRSRSETSEKDARNALRPHPLGRLATTRMQAPPSDSTEYGLRPNRVESPKATICAVVLLFLVPAATRAESGLHHPDTITKIALGSCADERRDHVILNAVIAAQPQLWVFLGDNVYADTADPAEMRAAYAMLGDKPVYQKLRETCPIIAIWDDHDYGVNDGGVEFPMKVTSEEIFHEFFETPADAPSRKRPGIYEVHTYGEEPGKRLQIIMLDTRYFRGTLLKLPERGKHGPYIPNPDPTETVLGDAQWTWLEQVLREPADLRIIASSIQFLPEDHAWEGWLNFPAERRRLLNLLKTTATGPVVFVSGDRHMGELMKLKIDDPSSPGFPVHEMTTSGLTHAGGGSKDEPNRHRISPQHYQSRNFGIIEINWLKNEAQLQLADVDGKIVDQTSVAFGNP